MNRFFERRPFGGLCGELLLFFATAALISAEPPSAVAIRNAHVVTVSGAELVQGTVLLRDGMIQDVGPNLPIPAGAWVIDGSALTVYPGFINAMSNWGIAEPAPVAPAAGQVSTPSVPGQQQPSAALQPRIHGPEDRPQTNSYQRAADLVRPADGRLEGVRALGFTSSATFPNRGIFTGLGALINLAGERGPDMVVAQPVGEQINLRTGGFRSFPGSLMGVMSYVRQLYLDLDQYQQAKAIYAAHVSGTPRPEYDHYLEGLAEAPRILLPADEAQQIDRMLVFAQELKQRAVLYGLHEAFLRIDELKQANVPVLINLHWPERPRDADPADVPSLRELERRASAPAVPALLAKAGVRFAFYSEGSDPASDIRRQVKRAIDAGLSRADAIRALTLSPAEIYGLSDRLGSIDKGKIANLVVTKGDAFEDKTTVEYVFVDGKLFKPSKVPPAPAPGRGGANPRTPPPDENADRAESGESNNVVAGEGERN